MDNFIGCLVMGIFCLLVGIPLGFISTYSGSPSKDPVWMLSILFNFASGVLFASAVAIVYNLQYCPK